MLMHAERLDTVNPHVKTKFIEYEIEARRYANEVIG